MTREELPASFYERIARREALKPHLLDARQRGVLLSFSTGLRVEVSPEFNRGEEKKARRIPIKEFPTRLDLLRKLNHDSWYVRVWKWFAAYHQPTSLGEL